MPPKRRLKPHVWVAATYVPLPEKLVIHGLRRGTVRVPADLKVDVLEVMCKKCRRPFEDVQGKSCTAAVDKDHLIGGPTGERSKSEDTPDQAAGQ